MSSGVPSSRRIEIASGVGGDADVAGAARADGEVQGAHGLVQRRVRVEAVVIEDVDVVEAHALEGGVQAADQVLARAEVAVRTGPEVPAGLRGDHQFVAVGLEVLAHVASEVRLRRAVGRAVVVGQVEVRDAQLEGSAQGGALVGERHVVAEVVPQAQGDRGKHQATASRAAVGHPAVVAGGIWAVQVKDWHEGILSGPRGLAIMGDQSKVRGPPECEGLHERLTG